MKKTSVVQAIVAAVLVILGGLALALAGEEPVRLEVRQQAGDRVTVEVNGEPTVVELGSLRDGEERSFPAGAHSLTVRRSGGALVVTLDGHELGAPGEVEADSFVWVQGDEAKVQRKVVVITDGEGGEGATSQVHVSTDDGAPGEHVRVVKIRRGAGSPGAEAELLALVGEGGLEHAHEGGCLDRVRFRCADDGTVVAIAKDKATQDSYSCPVCGRPMVKEEGPQVRVMTFVTEDEGAKPAPAD